MARYKTNDTFVDEQPLLAADTFHFLPSPAPPFNSQKLSVHRFCFHWQNSGLVVITDYELPGGFDDRMIMMAAMPDMESGV